MDINSFKWEPNNGFELTTWRSDTVLVLYRLKTSTLPTGAISTIATDMITDIMW